MTLASTTIRTATRVVPSRAMSNSAAPPRLHKAKDAWKELQTTRPPEGHPHNVFHPPYNKLTVGAMVLTVLSLGYGSMYMGMRHQQYKAGYWK